jgi:hypothetical protein
VKAQESREDLYIQRTKGYKAQIEEVQSRSAEKREARKAASISPDHGVWLARHDHAYTKPEDQLGPDIGPDMTPETKGDTGMDLSGYTDLSLIHSSTSEDRMADAIPDLVGAERTCLN